MSEDRFLLTQSLFLVPEIEREQRWNQWNWFF